MHSLSLAWRYLTFREKDSAIRFMTRICFASIAIGSCALMLTLIITHGFEHTIHEKMQGINADILISIPNERLDYDSLKETLLTQYPDTIASVTGSAVRQAIIEHNNINRVLFIKGIDPAHEPSVTSLAKKITQLKETSVVDTPFEKRFNLLNENKYIFIGHKCAQELGIQLGDKISLLLPEPTSAKRISLNKKKCIVAGLFNIGLDEYDNTVGYLALKQFNRFFKEEGVDSVAVKLKEHLRNKSFIDSFFNTSPPSLHIINNLKNRFPHLTIQSWQQLYPDLVASLKLEKYVMFFIIALITLVACMNMISLLFTLIQQKRSDIAIYKAMGMSQGSIRRIFLMLGMIITSSATLFGLGIAALIGYFLEYHSAIELPDVYYVSHLPARMDSELFIFVLGCSFLLGFIATWIPAIRAQKLNVTQTLRHE